MKDGREYQIVGVVIGGLLAELIGPWIYRATPPQFQDTLGITAGAILVIAAFALILWLAQSPILAIYKKWHHWRFRRSFRRFVFTFESDLFERIAADPTIKSTIAYVVSCVPVGEADPLPLDDQAGPAIKILEIVNTKAGGKRESD